MFWTLLFVMMTPAAEASCRLFLDGALGGSHAPFRRQLEDRLDNYDAVTAEIADFAFSTQRLDESWRELRPRVTWLERAIVERWGLPISPRAFELWKRHIAFIESDQKTEAATTRLNDERDRLEAFVLNGLVQDDEELLALSLKRQDVAHARKLAERCRKQIERTEKCVHQADLTYATNPYILDPDAWFNADLRQWIERELKRLNRELAELLPPAHNLGVRPGWSFARVRHDAIFKARLRRIRALIDGLDQELRALADDLDGQIVPLVNAVIDACLEERCAR